MVLNGNSQEDLLDAYLELKPLTFQDIFASIVKTIHPAESTYSNTGFLLEFNLKSTYSNTGSLLEFNLEPQKGTYTVPENMVLMLPVQFQNITTENFINIERFLPVNDFFGHFIESVSIYKKDDLTRIAPPLPSGSVGRYMSTIL